MTHCDKNIMGTHKSNFKNISQKKRMVNEGTEKGINLKIRNELGVTLSNSFKDEKEKRNYK